MLLTQASFEAVRTGGQIGQGGTVRAGVRSLKRSNRAVRGSDQRQGTTPAPRYHIYGSKAALRGPGTV